MAIFLLADHARGHAHARTSQLSRYEVALVVSTIIVLLPVLLTRPPQQIWSCDVDGQDITTFPLKF
ncbi:hypothetical protein LMG29542_08091 [Paraburkholderia humisilvae]|uniref:Uncharacterized protein n=1 Tax=Paraburkholderia humisilvae TaxID=627669 RepID=A0A6J5F8L7_9BURK|nr:hypothetical protein LMG29542_08091 [Paraburkholderia humisilvae]